MHEVPGQGSFGVKGEYLLELSSNQVMYPTLNQSSVFLFLAYRDFSLFYELKYACENIFPARVCMGL